MTDTPHPDQPAGGTPPGAPGGPDPLRGAFRRALVFVVVLVGLLAVVGSAVGFVVADPPSAGVWGALLGATIALVFSGSTVLAMLLTARSSLTVASGALVGTWLVKTLLLLVAIVLLRDADFFDPAVLVVVTVLGVLGSVVLDYRAVTTARVPYVDGGGAR
ncbi:MAG: hypothetical protein H5T83_10890 [Actinotalea sp.]|nr:hypothetical protein [Actinotalea sp.]